MTKDEVLKLALSTLNEVRSETFRLLRNGQKLYAEEKVWNTITGIEEVLNGCQCPECQVKPHASDCAVHSEPAYPKGACNCGAQPEQKPQMIGRITDNIKDMVLRQEVMLYTDKYLPIGTPVYTTPPQRNTMPITDDNGKALRPQYRVIEQRGNWILLYDQHQLGNTVPHEFRIQKLKHDIMLYTGISLAEATKRFHEKVEADHE